MEKQMIELESQNKALKVKQMLASNRSGGSMMMNDSLGVGSTNGSSPMLQLSQQQQQQLQLRQLRQQAAMGVGTAGGVNLAQLSRYMNGQNGYF